MREINMSEDKTIAAAILAAGQGRRFAATGGGNKLLASLRGRPLIRHVTEAALAAPVHPVLVVTGHDAETIEETLEGLPLTFVRNGDHAMGLATSLQSVVSSLPDRVEGVVVLLGDMPLVSAALIAGLAEAFKAQPVKPAAVVPVHQGRWGNPVLLGRALFGAIGHLEGDRGARTLIEAVRDHVLEWNTADAGILFDIDTEAGLESVR